MEEAYWNLEVAIVVGFGFTMVRRDAYVKRGLHHLTWTAARKLFLVLPVFAALLIALCIAYFLAQVQAPRPSIVPFANESEMKAILLNTLFFVSIVSLGVLFIYFTLKKGGIAILGKMFGIAGGLLTLFLSGFLSIHLFRLFPSLLAGFLVWLCDLFIALSIAFTIVGIFSEETRNLMYMMYSSVAGGFLALGIPMFSMVYILLSVCIIDLVLYRAGILRRMADLSKGEAIFFHFRYSDMELMIGLGDLVYYSMFASYSLVNFGPLTAALSVILILIGWVLTFSVTTRSEIFAGLPIPIVLGLVPVILSLNRIYILLLAIPLGIDRLIVIAKPKMTTRIGKLAESKPVREILARSKIVKVPKYPDIRTVLGLITLMTVLVAIPLVLTPLSFGVSLQYWLIVSLNTYEQLFTHSLLIPFVYIGIVNSMYLVMGKRIRRLFTTALLLSYLVWTTVIVPIQFHLVEIFESLVFVLPLYVSVTCSLIYSIAEPSVLQGDQNRSFDLHRNGSLHEKAPDQQSRQLSSEKPSQLSSNQELQCDSCVP